jgi:hypothetical protein
MVDFLKKYKKFVIIFSIIFVILLTIIILIFTLFSLKNVSLDLKTETNILNEEMQQEIIDTVNNEYIPTVLFVDKQGLISKLEKQFPYLKIVNIETKIPSEFVIHCVEREEFYAIQSEGKTYYLDEELKILKIEEWYFEGTSSNAVLLNIANLNLNIGNAEEGQFLKFNNENLTDASSILANQAQETLLSLLNAFEENNRNIAVVRANFNSFEINFKFQQVEDGRIWYLCLSIIHNTGFETEIVEANEDLSQKIEIMLNRINEISTTSPEDLLTKKLTVYKNSSGNLVYLLV